MKNPAAVLQELDEIEGYNSTTPNTSLYTRRATQVALDDGNVVEAWAYLHACGGGSASRPATISNI